MTGRFGRPSERCHTVQVRSEPDPSGSEAELLSQYLDYQRETVLAKTEGLDQEQMARPHPPSALTLGGLLCHLALVEENIRTGSAGPTR